jgi:hypothetical protein
MSLNEVEDVNELIFIISTGTPIFVFIRFASMHRSALSVCVGINSVSSASKEFLRYTNDMRTTNCLVANVLCYEHNDHTPKMVRGYNTRIKTNSEAL